MTEEANPQSIAEVTPAAPPLPATAQLLAHARAELGRVIAGQTESIDEALIALLCQGHVLLEGVPGIAKTLIVKALGRLLGLGRLCGRLRSRQLPSRVRGRRRRLPLHPIIDRVAVLRSQVTA